VTHSIWLLSMVTNESAVPAWDYEKRIVKITRSDVTKAEFAYDALGRRIKKVDSVVGTTNIYYYNESCQVLQ